MTTFAERVFKEILRLRYESLKADPGQPTIEVSMHPETREALEHSLPRDMLLTYGPGPMMPGLPHGAFWRAYDALFFEDRREIKGAAFLRVNGKGASAIGVVDEGPTGTPGQQSLT